MIVNWQQAGYPTSEGEHSWEGGILHVQRSHLVIWRTSPGNRFHVVAASTINGTTNYVLGSELMQPLDHQTALA